MINRNDIEKLVNETLDSFDGLQKAEPKPFMFTRIMARMNRENVTILEKIVSLASRPVVAFATVILFLVINAFVLFSISGSATPEEVQEPALVADSDYGLSVSSMYDINPEQNDLVQK